MQVSFLCGMKPESLPEYILTVNPENLTRCVDYRDREGCSLFGDASTAAVLSKSIPSRMTFSACHYGSKPSAWGKVMIPRMGHFDQDGNAVQGFAIRKTTECLRDLRREFNVNSNRFKFVGHQANRGMLQTVCERCNIPDDNHWHNVAYFGNQASAGAPAVISQHWEEMVPGTHVAIVLVGAGLTWVRIMLRVREQI